jgi:hypothetical protein
MLFLSPAACLQPMHMTSLPLSLVLCPPHTYDFCPMLPYVSLSFSRNKPNHFSPVPSWLTLVLRANRSQQVGFQGPFCFCIIACFHRPCALLAACFTLVSCSAYCSTLKMEVTCSCEMSVDFQRTIWCYIPVDRTLQVMTYQPLLRDLFYWISWSSVYHSFIFGRFQPQPRRQISRLQCFVVFPTPSR